MSARPEVDFHAFLRAQRSEYARGIPERVAQIARDAERVARDPSARVPLEHAAHALAGSSGTFGFMDLSRAARALELAAPHAPPEQLASLLHELERCRAHI